MLAGNAVHDQGDTLCTQKRHGEKEDGVSQWTDNRYGILRNNSNRLHLKGPCFAGTAGTLFTTSNRKFETPKASTIDDGDSVVWFMKVKSRGNKGKESET